MAFRNKKEEPNSSLDTRCGLNHSTGLIVETRHQNGRNLLRGGTVGTEMHPYWKGEASKPSKTTRTRCCDMLTDINDMAVNALLSPSPRPPEQIFGMQTPKGFIDHQNEFKL